MARRARPGLVVSLVIVAGCATSSSKNFSADYRANGPATASAAFNAAAQKAFNAEPASPEQKQAISSVRVYIDSMPPELTAKDNVIAVSEGTAATLIGTVELTAVWSAPTEEEVLPALQKAAHAADANLSFCPRRGRPDHIWRCYLVRTEP